MIIKNFRVYNYKSIKDSGDCYLSIDGITTLAGRNESGKSSLLEALEDFDTDKQIRAEAIPVDKSGQPQIDVCFEVSKTQLESILNDAGIKQELGDEEYMIKLHKIYEEGYRFDDESVTFLNLDDIDNSEIEVQINDLTKEILAYTDSVPQINSDHLKNLDISDIQAAKTAVEQFLNQANPQKNHIPDPTNRNNFEPKTRELLGLIEKIIQTDDPKKSLLDTFLEYIPRIILFSSFEDVFPNKIPTAELSKDEWVQDLSAISTLDVDELISNNKQDRLNHKNAVNIDMNEQYSKFWTQDLIGLEVDIDKEELSFWIKENEHLYMPSQRSKGQQWHLAFYIRVTARAREDVRNVILIDEPGLYLHAKAQRDILNKLEDIANEVQVVFSTHSSYLLEYDKMHRIKLVTKTKKLGTTVENKIHARADKETLTPILTAIGLELTSGIESLDRKNNVVAEGQSDVFYIQAFIELLDGEYDFNVIFGGGAGNMPIVGTVLQGWGCEVLYLYDNDQGKKDGEKNLKNKWNVKDEVMRISKDDSSIEDLFTKGDFKKLVLKDTTLDYKSSNSEYMKKSKFEKVLSAKLFRERVKEDKSKIKLTETTKNNFKSILDKISNFFATE